MLVLALEALGREEDARARMAEVVELIPRVNMNYRTVTFLNRYADQERAQEVAAIYRHLGMPEE